MKVLITLAILIIIGILAYHFFIDSGPVTEEQQELKMLEKDFDRALKQLEKAGRMTGLSGMDNTSEAEDVINSVERIKENLGMLKDRLKDDNDIRKAEALEERVKRFLRENR